MDQEKADAVIYRAKALRGERHLLAADAGDMIIKTDRPKNPTMTGAQRHLLPPV